jgi:hypothetical protein
MPGFRLHAAQQSRTMTEILHVESLFMRHMHRAVVLVLLFVPHSLAQSQKAGAASPSQSASTEMGEAARRNDDALLARAATLYYSTKAAGLTGFDCVVHPDWVKLMQSSESQSPLTEGNLPVLNGVAISLRARLNGGSTLEWIQPSIANKPLDQASSEAIDDVHKTVEKTLMDFMQFWTPIVDGSMIPRSSAGIEIRHSSTGMVLLLRQPDAQVLEVFSNELVLKEVRIITGGKMIDIVPSYDSADDIFLVNKFVARTGSATVAATDQKEMNTEIEYRTVDGFPIPSRLNMEVGGTGTFNFKLDSCRANPTR